MVMAEVVSVRCVAATGWGTEEPIGDIHEFGHFCTVCTGTHLGSGGSKVLYVNVGKNRSCTNLVHIGELGQVDKEMELIPNWGCA